MAVEKGRYAGIDLGKRTLETAVITRTGKYTVNTPEDAEPEERARFFKGETTAEGPLLWFCISIMNLPAAEPPPRKRVLGY
jgi:hypothetical protein